MFVIVPFSFLIISLSIIIALSEFASVDSVVVAAVIVVIIEQQIMIGLVITGVIIEMTSV